MNTLNHFWKRWRTEYLLQLRERHSYSKNGVKNREPKIGEVVLLRSDSKLRGLCKLAREKMVELEVLCCSCPLESLAVIF